MENDRKVVRIPTRDETSLSARMQQALGGADRPDEIFHTADAPHAPAGHLSTDHLSQTNSRSPEPAHGARSGEEQPADGVLLEVELADILPSPYQTRQFLDEEQLGELIQSISSSGVVQPVIVRPRSVSPSGTSHSGIGDSGKDDIARGREPRFELVAGERRYRAAAALKLRTIPALVRLLPDAEAVQVSIIENAQRENLNPVEEALSFKILTTQFKMSQSEIAERIGKSRPAVSNALRLLHLDERVLELLRQGLLSAGHGRALLMLDDADLQLRVAKRAVRNGLSVHALEKLIYLYLENDEEEELSEDEQREQASLERMRTRVGTLLGLEEVELKHDSQGRKRLNLVFDTEASWKRFMSKIRT